jgi:hypothetical protein
MEPFEPMAKLYGNVVAAEIVNMLVTAEAGKKCMSGGIVVDDTKGKKESAQHVALGKITITYSSKESLERDFDKKIEEIKTIKRPGGRMAKRTKRLSGKMDEAT